MEKPYFSIRRRPFSLVRETFFVLDEQGACVAVLRLKRSYGGIFLFNRLAVLMLIGVFAGLLLMYQTAWGLAQPGLVRAAVIISLGAAGGALYALIRSAERRQSAVKPDTKERMFMVGEDRQGTLYAATSNFTPPDSTPLGRLRWADEEESKLAVEDGEGNVACVLSPPASSAGSGQTEMSVEIRDDQETILGNIAYGKGRRRFEIRVPPETRDRLDERLLWLAAVRGRFMSGRNFPVGLAP